MIYILGVKIPNYLNLVQGLTRIYGLGFNGSKRICTSLGFLDKIKVRNLVEKDWNLILDFIKRDKKKKVLKDLKRIERKFLWDLIDCRNYRGLRHTYGLPVRGQRTHSNGKTQAKLAKIRLGSRRFSTSSVFNSFYGKLQLLPVARVNVSLDNSSNFDDLLQKRLKIFKKRNVKLFTKIKIKRKKRKIRNKIFFRNFKLNSSVLIIRIFSRLNNVFISAYSASGELKILVSGGSVGFTGRRKYTDYAAKMAVDKVIKFINDKKLKRNVILKLRGFGKARKAAVKRFKRRGFKIRVIEDVTPVAHNGCKARKLRRI